MGSRRYKSSFKPSGQVYIFLLISSSNRTKNEAYETAEEFFGSNKVRFAGVDGTMYSREPLEGGVDAEEFNEAVQKVLLELNAKDVFTQAAVFERAYGWSIVIVGYQDKAPTLKAPVLKPEKIVSLEAYSPPLITDVKIDKNKNSPASVCQRP